MKNHKNNLMRDLGIIVFGIVIAVILVKTEALKDLLAVSKNYQIIGSFIAGIFFVSVFTAAPATIALVEIAQINSLIPVAIFGALGALVGDLLIFRFVKDRLSAYIIEFISGAGLKKISTIIKKVVFRWIMAILGAVIIASPLPDELGLALMGISRIKIMWFIPLSFLLNFLGILFIGYLAQL